MNTPPHSLITQRLKKAYDLIILIAMVASFSVFFSYYNVMKHYSFMTYMFDLGIYMQKLFFAFNGEILNFVVWRRPIMYLILPFYALMPRAELLLIMQPLIVALGAFPLYLLAKDELDSRGAGLCFAALYLLYPPLHGLTSFDFHVEAFLPFLIFYALHYHGRRAYFKYVFFIILTVLTLEWVYPTVLFLGFYLLVTQRQYRVLRLLRDKLIIRVRVGNVRLSLMTIGIVLVATSLFIYFQHRAFHVYQAKVYQAFSTVLMMVGFQAKFDYIVNLFGPLGFFSFLSPLALLPSIPWFMFSFGIGGREHIVIYNQYSAFVAPFIFLACIKGVKVLLHNGGTGALLRAIAVLFIATTLFNLTASPLLSSPSLTKPWPAVGEREAVLSALVSSIPQNASVLTQNNIAPHLANRYGLYASPARVKGSVDYILVDKKNPFFMNGPPNPPVGVGLREMLERWNYTIAFEYDGIILYKSI